MRRCKTSSSSSYQRSFPYRRSWLRAAPDRRAKSRESTPRKIHAPLLKRQLVFPPGAGAQVGVEAAEARAPERGVYAASSGFALVSPVQTADLTDYQTGLHVIKRLP